MITALIYIAVIIVVYMVVDISIYFGSGQGPKAIIEAIILARGEPDLEKAREMATAAVERLENWNEKERKMEYKSAWAASRLAKALVLLKKRFEQSWTPEYVAEVDALAANLERAIPKYIETLTRAIFIAVILALLIRGVVIQAFKIPSGSMIPTLEVGDQLLVTKFTYGIRLPFSSKRILDFRKPQHGDIVVFKPPRSVMSSWVEHEVRIPFTDHVLYRWSSQVDFIKRIVGLPGDKVEIKNGTLYINDKAMPLVADGKFEYERANLSYVRNVQAWLFTEYIDGRPHKVLYSSDKLEDENYGPYYVGPGEFFAMGDNRDDSADSRTWTSDPAHIEDIRGKALIIHFSWDPARNRPRFGRMGHLIR